MSSDQITALLGRKRRQMPGVCPGGGGDVEALIWLIHKQYASTEKNTEVPKTFMAFFANFSDCFHYPS